MSHMSLSSFTKLVFPFLRLVRELDGAKAAGDLLCSYDDAFFGAEGGNGMCGEEKEGADNSEDFDLGAAEEGEDGGHVDVAAEWVGRSGVGD